MEASPRGSLGPLCWSIFAFALVCLGKLPGNCQEPSARGKKSSPPDPIEQEIADYLKKHPEVLDDRITKHLKEHPEEVAGGLSGGYDNGFYLKTSGSTRYRTWRLSGSSLCERAYPAFHSRSVSPTSKCSP